MTVLSPISANKDYAVVRMEANECYASYFSFFQEANDFYLSLNEFDYEFIDLMHRRSDHYITLKTKPTATN